MGFRLVVLANDMLALTAGSSIGERYPLIADLRLATQESWNHNIKGIIVTLAAGHRLPSTSPICHNSSCDCSRPFQSNPAAFVYLPTKADI